MASMQKLIMIGYLGKDPETRYTPSGAAVCAFSVATTERWKDKQSGEQKEITEWHNCEAWGRTAEVCGEYLHKGDQVYLEGKVRTEEYEDKEGNRRWSVKVRVDSVQFLTAKGERSAPPQQQEAAPRQESAPAGATNDLDDDIPF
jgi:single-strand DNA-binding protein